MSVSEFWGARWNTAFRDVAHRFVFRPLARRFDGRVGVTGAFLFSGLVHELSISVPARGGYGGPMFFFVIQAIALAIERSRFGQRVGLGRGLTGWAFTALVVMAPACVLFHPPFVRQIVVPFWRALNGG